MLQAQQRLLDLMFYLFFDFFLTYFNWVKLKGQLLQFAMNRQITLLCSQTQ